MLEGAPDVTGVVWVGDFKAGCFVAVSGCDLDIALGTVEVEVSPVISAKEWDGCVLLIARTRPSQLLHIALLPFVLME